MRRVNKRQLKKVSVILIVLVMLFGVTLSALAAQGPGTPHKAAPAVVNELLKEVTHLENNHGYYISQVARNLGRNASREDVKDYLEELGVSFSSPATASAALSSHGEKLDVLIGFEGTPNTGLIRAFGGEIYYEFTIIDVIATSIPENAIKGLQDHPLISYIEPDAEVYALEQNVPWGIDRVFGDEEYKFPTWQESTGVGIGVAVLDTGIDGDHEDLPELSGGTNTIDDTDWDSDGSGHGTHVAGTIAALDNDYGVVGVSPDVDLYAVKVLDDSGSGTVSTVVAGIEWAVEEEIPIINMSLGSSSYSETLQDACNTAYEEGSLLVASAGNSGNRGGGGDNVGYPARFDSVTAVAASNSRDQRASFSSTGPDVELIAPGANIFSTVPDNEYTAYNGTSMAAPHVTGTAALVWAVNSELTNSEVREILTSTAEDLGLSTNHQGNGLVRADLSVAVVPEIEPKEEYTLTIAVEGNGTTEPEPGEHVYLDGTAVELKAIPDENWEFDKWEIDGQDYNDDQITITMDADQEVNAYFSQTEPPDVPAELVVEITSPEDGTEYTWNSWVNIAVKVTDHDGVAVTGTSVMVEVVGVTSYEGTTDTDGIYTTRYRVANRSQTGPYTINAEATVGEDERVQAEPVTFKVTGR